MDPSGVSDEESEGLPRLLSNKQLQRLILRPKKMKMQTSLAGAPFDFAQGRSAPHQQFTTNNIRWLHQVFLGNNTHSEVQSGVVWLGDFSVAHILIIQGVRNG